MIIDTSVDEVFLQLFSYKLISGCIYISNLLN